MHDSQCQKLVRLVLNSLLIRLLQRLWMYLLYKEHFRFLWFLSTCPQHTEHLVDITLSKSHNYTRHEHSKEKVKMLKNNNNLGSTQVAMVVAK